MKQLVFIEERPHAISGQQIGFAPVKMGASMEGTRERFSIKIREGGLVITDEKGMRLKFTASEALMLLDILTQEQKRLRNMAQEASPAPIKIRV